MNKKTLFYNIGDIVPVLHFGKPSKVKIIDIDRHKCLYQCQEIDNYGSSWYSDFDLYNHKKRVDEYYRDNNGPTGHGDICYSDADPGL